MNLDHLAKIQRVEVPPYVFTRITKKIESEKSERMPLKMALIINLSFAAILIINAMVFIGNDPKSNSIENYAESIHLMSNYTLYE
jgi:hypothetical protein